MTGRTVWKSFDTHGNVVMRYDHPVDEIIKTNAEQASVASSDWRGDYHMIASIPLDEAWQSGLVRAHSEGDEKFVSRWLNDGDNRAWRTKAGTV